MRFSILSLLVATIFLFTTASIGASPHIGHSSKATRLAKAKLAALERQRASSQKAKSAAIWKSTHATSGDVRVSKISKSAQEAASRKDPYSPIGIFLQSQAALAAAISRCATNRACAVQVTPIANSFAVCSLGRCSLRCSAGFSPSGTACAPQPDSCSGVTCPVVTNGYSSCQRSAAGSICVSTCQQGQGLVLVSNGAGAFSCVAPLSDVNNCGRTGNVCPSSYNSVGSRRCRQGSCDLVCPAGTMSRRIPSLGVSYCGGSTP